VRVEEKGCPPWQKTGKLQAALAERGVDARVMAVA
jgi:hypothetical protein